MWNRNTKKSMSVSRLILSVSMECMLKSILTSTTLSTSSICTIWKISKEGTSRRMWSTSLSSKTNRDRRKRSMRKRVVIRMTACTTRCAIRGKALVPIKANSMNRTLAIYSPVKMTSQMKRMWMMEKTKESMRTKMMRRQVIITSDPVFVLIETMCW